MRQEHFNNVAARWDSLASPEAGAKLIAIVAASGLDRGMRVLDVGCGTGLLTPFLREAVGATGLVIGLDFAAEMVRLAAAKNFGPNVRFQAGDAADMPFPDGDFDAVFCNNCFPHLPDKPGVLREFKRVLGSGGILVICHTSSRQAVNQMHERIGGAVAHDRVPAGEDMRRMLSEAGFDVREIDDGADRYVARATRPRRAMQ